MKSCRAALLLFGLGLLFGLSRPAAAAVPPQIDTCRACHGQDGISASADIPNLAGQKQAYLARQLEAFRSGERKNPLMAAIAAQLSDADIQALALAWSRTGTIAPGTVAALPSRMTFPAAFPQGFTLYESIAEGEQLTRRYANDVALRAAREGRPLPDGAVIVVANLAGGKVTSYAGMAVQAGWGADVPELLRNGDWHYALFSADGTRRDGAGQAACLACHKPVAADSYVFTMKALRAAATPH